MIALGVLPVRGAWFCFTSNPVGVVAIQLLDGVAAGIFGVISILIAADSMKGAGFTGFQLKIVQEVVTLLVFIVFAVTFLKEKLAWNDVVACGFLAVAAFFAFAFKPGGGAG